MIYFKLALKLLELAACQLHFFHSLRSCSINLQYGLMILFWHHSSVFISYFYLVIKDDLLPYCFWMSTYLLHIKYFYLYEIDVELLKQSKDYPHHLNPTYCPNFSNLPFFIISFYQIWPLIFIIVNITLWFY